MHHLDIERRVRLPADAPARLIEDIETYTALMELQTKLTASAPWFGQLS